MTGEKQFARQGPVEIFDVVTFFHLTRGRVIDRERMESALEHLQAATDQSLASWEKIILEQDNDNEWIPNAEQQSVMATFQVSIDMMTGWEAFLTEVRAVLSGTKLLPFWRGDPDDGLGVNLRKAFVESEWFVFEQPLEQRPPFSTGRAKHREKRQHNQRHRHHLAAFPPR